MSALTNDEILSLLSRVLKHGAPLGLEVEISNAISRLVSASSAIQPKTLSEDAILKALYASGLGVRPLIYESCKDGICIDRTTVQVDNFVKAILAAAANAPATEVTALSSATADELARELYRRIWKTRNYSRLAFELNTLLGNNTVPASPPTDLIIGGKGGCGGGSSN